MCQHQRILGFSICSPWSFPVSMQPFKELVRVGLTAHANLLTSNRFLGSSEVAESFRKAQIQQWEPLCEQLLPPTAVDPMWCWYPRWLDSDIAKLPHNRNLGVKRMAYNWWLWSGQAVGMVGKNQEIRKFLNTTRTTWIRLPAHYFSSNLYPNNLLNFITSTRSSRKSMACWNNMFIKGTLICQPLATNFLSSSQISINALHPLSQHKAHAESILFTYIR